MCNNKFDLQRWVINESSFDRPTISTAFNQGCGGYAAQRDYVYEIGIPSLHSYKLNEESMGTKRKQGLHQWAGELPLYLSHPAARPADALQQSGSAVGGIIGLDLLVPTTEVAFFTAIPSANVIRFRRKGESNWNAMATQQADPPEVQAKLNMSKYAAFLKG